MCKRKPGLRCSNAVRCSMEKHEAALAESDARLHAAYVRHDEILSQLDSGKLDEDEQLEAADELRVLTKTIKSASKTSARLVGEVDRAQAEYNLTTQGMEELEAKAKDESLSVEERLQAEKDLINAKEERKNRLTRFANRGVAWANLNDALVDAGVDADTIADIQRQFGADHGNPHVRSAKDYQKQMELHGTTLDVAPQTHAYEVNQLGKKLKRGELTQEQHDATVKKASDKHRITMIKAERSFDKAQFGYDTTKEGQAELQGRLVSVNPYENLEEWSEVGARLDLAQKRYKAGMTDREARVELKNQVEAVMAAKGKSPAPALAALKAKVRTDEKGNRLKPPVRSVAPDLKKSTVKAYLSGSDQDRLVSEFRASKEFASNGDAGLQAYVNRRILADPRKRHTVPSVDAANAQAAMGFDNRGHRHLTRPEGARSAGVNIQLTVADKRRVEATAASLHMTSSSYMQHMMLGRNPFAVQNDRSALVNARKTEAMRELLGERSSIAA